MFKDYPIIIQNGKSDCGICCLSMILSYHGIDVSMEKLRVMTKSNSEGTNALNLINASKKLGVSAIGVAGDFRKIEKFPAVAHFILENNYLHFVVIYKINFENKTLLIGDPAVGIVDMTFEEFEHKSSKVFILFDKDNKKVKIKDLRFKLFIKKIIIANKKLIAKSFVLSLCVILFSLLFSFYLRSMLETINNNKYLYILAFIFLIISIIKNILGYFKNKIIDNLSINIDKNVTIDTYKHLFRLPYQYLMSKSDGEIFSVISDLADFKDTIIRVLLVGLIDITMLSSVFIFFSIINISFMIYGVLLFIILFLISKYYNNFFYNLFVKLKRTSMLLTSYLLEVISSVEVIKNLNIYDKITENLNNKYQNYLDDIKNYNKIYNSFSLKKDLIQDIFFVLMILSSAIMIIKGEMSLYDLVLFESLYLIFSSSLNDIVDNLVVLKNYIVGINRVLDIYDISEENLSNSNYKSYKNIECKNLSFSYGNKIVFNNLNLNIKEGDKVLVSGKSGSGKSTLIKIIMKYIKDYKGKILLNGENLSKINSYVVRENITYVSQNDKLFSDTIKNNIIIGSKFSNNLDEVCNIVGLNDLLKEKSLNYFIEEQGVNLSGGEKKRILIARALLRNSNIIVFDESFNEIDQKLERSILEKMFKTYKNKTIIVISHRKTSIDLFDRCLKIDNKIVGGKYEKVK